MFRGVNNKKNFREAGSSKGLADFTETSDKEELLRDVDDVDYPYLASNPFPPLPQSQLLDFEPVAAFDSVKSDSLPSFDPVEQAIHEARLNVESSQPAVSQNKKFEPPAWTPPLIPAAVYCLNNRLDNGTTAFSSLLFHLDLALEDYPNRHPHTQKHHDLRNALDQQVQKMRQMNKQFTKSKKEIRRILDLDYY